ncbi:MAG: mercury(II) reductase [Chloroflexi bacterium]|nr:mercury(II) reductase [Chloroflexota bacterium]
MNSAVDRYDLVIIGGGAAAFGAATRAWELGASAVLINAGLPLGGTCVNVGCVPSKLLLEIGAERYLPQHPRFKALIGGSIPPFDFAAAMGEKDEIVAALRERNYHQVAAGLGVKVVEGRARFTSPHEVEVNGQPITGERFLIATGSRPQIPSFPGLEQAGYLTSREALSLARLPESMIVVGAGPLGLEFAQVYARFGTRVTVLQRGWQILSRAEPEVAAELRRCLEDEGIGIHTMVDIQEMRREGNLKVVVARQGAREAVFRAEELLLATSVVPNSDGLGLERAGVAVDERGFIPASPQMQTSAPHIWAAGDVVGRAFLETVAAKEGYLAAGNALEGADKTIDYDSVPRAVFTDPQVASVGLTEAETMRRYQVCSCRTLNISQVPKAKAMKETRGLVKMVVHPQSEVVLGVHMVAPMAADLIHEAALAVRFRLTLSDIIDTVHVFPTLSEAIKLVAQSFKRDISAMSCCVE